MDHEQDITMRRLAIISNQAFSLINFRGPLIRDLVAAGVEVHALAPDYDERIRKQVESLGAIPVDYSLSRTGMNSLRDSVDFLRLQRVLRSIRPDATLGYFIKPVIYGTLAAWLAGVPQRFALIEGLGYTFIESEDEDSWRRTMLRRFVSFLYRIALKKTEKTFFLNGDDISDFVEWGVVDQAKAIKLGGIGIDLAEWPFQESQAQPPTFLLAARLLREKGIVEYAEAARKVKQLHPEARFILLGGLDPNPGALKQAEIEQWVHEGLLEWPGHVDVKPWLAQASVYVLPSYREGVPRSTQEAMAMGRPVITTDAPGCRETVEDGRNGYLVPVRDSEALAQAMLRFIEQPELIERMGKESRRIAEEKFDVRKINAVILGAMDVPANSVHKSEAVVSNEKDTCDRSNGLCGQGAAQPPQG